jgi:hypothetical protein
LIYVVVDEIEIDGIKDDTMKRLEQYQESQSSTNVWQYKETKMRRNTFGWEMEGSGRKTSWLERGKGRVG